MTRGEAVVLVGVGCGRGRVGGVVSDTTLGCNPALAFRLEKAMCNRTWSLTCLGSNLGHPVTNNPLNPSRLGFPIC